MEIVETTKPAQLRLRETFLAPYRRKGDPFTSLLARSTYLTKYCRGNVETWTDTIRRVVEGNCSLAVGVSEAEAELLFHLFWTGQALPPGRGLWTGGVEGIPADARYNCFSSETKFLANGRVTAFEEVVGQTVEVLCVDGTWRPAEVRSFGKQPLRTVKMKPPGRTNFEFNFQVTPNHRWITNNRGEVTDLRVGDRVLVTPQRVDSDSSEFHEGFAHGLLFGDGTAETQKVGVFKIRLCADKDKKYQSLLERTSKYTSTCTPPSCNGDPVLFFKSNEDLKALPRHDAGVAYQAGFLKGWLAADGGVRSSGNRLNSINAEALQWAIDRGPLLGYCVTGYSTLSNMETNLGPRSAPLHQVSFSEAPVEYTVRSISDEGREEEVFCVVEPETRSFTLAGGVPTGNCWFTTLYGVDDWCWTANQLMLGGGVGVGLNSIESMPGVTDNDARFAIWCSDHENLDEVKPEGPAFLNGSTPTYRVPDSREGWVEALRRTMRAAFEGTDLVMDVSDIRPRGRMIKTFGGVACGPGPLAHLLRSSWRIIRGARGRKLTSVEALDVTNHIGLCIKAGNVRRSALIVLGNPYDQLFRDAKKDWEAVKSHRHTSNNSIVFSSWDQLKGFDWKGLVADNVEFGEPGILNLPLVWQTDPGAKGVNPCGEQALHDREACNLAEVFPAKFESGTNSDMAFRLVTRYCLRNRLTPLSDPQSHSVGMKNMRVGVGLGGICDFDWRPEQLAGWFGACRKEADSYADELGVSHPITVTTVKPSGTTSLLNESSPGIHAPHAPFYIRRTRIAKNDPQAAAMMEAGVPYEDCIYDKTGHTWVFSFPTAAPHTRTTKATETILEQFERQATVQEWWADNAVSATLNFNPETERNALAQCLETFVPRLKSTSCLASAHGYAQAPYETISEDAYRQMASKINHDHKLVHGGEIEVEECAGGACPVR